MRQWKWSCWGVILVWQCHTVPTYNFVKRCWMSRSDTAIVNMDDVLLCLGDFTLIGGVANGATTLKCHLGYKIVLPSLSGHLATWYNNRDKPWVNFTSDSVSFRRGTCKRFRCIFYASHKPNQYNSTLSSSRRGSYDFALGNERQRPQIETPEAPGAVGLEGTPYPSVRGLEVPRKLLIYWFPNCVFYGFWSWKLVFFFVAKTKQNAISILYRTLKCVSFRSF